jgi:hypothetical protein
LKNLMFLFIDYKCDKWWFEVADMMRRIVFIGILPLVSPDPATRASFGLLLGILGSVYFSTHEPYRADFTNVIAYIAQVFVIYITCLRKTSLHVHMIPAMYNVCMNIYVHGGVFLVCISLTRT